MGRGARGSFAGVRRMLMVPILAAVLSNVVSLKVTIESDDDRGPSQSQVSRGTDVPSGTLTSVLKQAGLKSKEPQMRYLVVVERGPTSFGAYVPDLPGCVAAGDTRAEAMTLIREAIELHISDLKQNGRPVPPPSSTPEIAECMPPNSRCAAAFATTKSRSLRRASPKLGGGGTSSATSDTLE